MRNGPIIVSHGYENIYERGFCNGLSDNAIGFVLISSDRTDYRGLRPGTQTVNLRGSQQEARPRREKFLNLLKYHIRLVWYVLQRRRPVVHVIGMLDPAIFVGVVEGAIFRLWSRSYLLTAHNLLPHDRGSLVTRFCYALSYRLASVLIVHTERAKQEIGARYRIDPGRIRVMEHGIEPLDPAGLQPRAPRPDASLRILFFGKVMRYKGLDILLDALRGFPVPFQLHIAGRSVDPSLGAELSEAIAAHPQRHAIEWRDEFVPESDIAGMFAWADVVALPYRRIDQSGILFQALRHGVPVVATPVGAFVDYVRQDVGIVCRQADADSFRGGLLEMAGRLGSLSREGIMARAKQYEWQVAVRSILGLYDRGSR